MKNRLAFPQGILGVYTAIIIAGSMLPIAQILRSPLSPKVLPIIATVYFLTVGIFLWLRIHSAIWLFLGGILGLCTWSIWGMISRGFSFQALILLIAWLIAIPGTLVIREEISAWHAATAETGDDSTISG
ncbi:MAG: hypothetical protein GY835_25740 [bacterium]|nr:hypothetical protein [bacterium]